MSSFIGGRSGNRGECAQPCRMQYNGRYPLSLKDLCLAAHITEILDTGVASLKIEGRMKSPDYVYAVVSTYRTLLDERRNATQQEMDFLARVFSRDGFSDGYFTGVKENMHGIRSQSDKEATERLSIRQQDKRSEREPVTVSERKHRLPEALELSYPSVKFKTHRSARWYKPQFMIPENFDINYIPLDSFEHFSANGVLLPPVIPDSEREAVKEKLIRAKKKGALHALVGNVGHIALAKELGFILHGDYRLNAVSNACVSVYKDIFEDIILSPELITPQLRDIKAK